MNRLLLLITLAALPNGATAGNHAISGQVVDRNGQPLEQVIIAMSPGNVAMVTDREGRFLIQYLRDEDGKRLKLAKRSDYEIEAYKVGFHTESRAFFYKRGEVKLVSIQLTEDTILIHDDGADLSETFDNKPTHSAGANYEGQ